MNRKAILRLARIALGLCLMSIAPVMPAGAGSADGGNVTSNWRIPFQGTYFVDNGASSELVDFSGSAHLVVKFVPPNPTVPPNPISLHTNLVSLNGVGWTSGQSYRLTGAANFELDADAGSAFEFSGSYRLTPVDPCANCPAQFLPIRYVVTLNSAGEVTAATAEAGGSTSVDSE